MVDEAPKNEEKLGSSEASLQNAWIKSADLANAFKYAVFGGEKPDIQIHTPLVDMLVEPDPLPVDTVEATEARQAQLLQDYMAQIPKGGSIEAELKGRLTPENLHNPEMIKKAREVAEPMQGGYLPVNTTDVIDAYEKLEEHRRELLAGINPSKPLSDIGQVKNQGIASVKQASMDDLDAMDEAALEEAGFDDENSAPTSDFDSGPSLKNAENKIKGLVGAVEYALGGEEPKDKPHSPLERMIRGSVTARPDTVAPTAAGNAQVGTERAQLIEKIQKTISASDNKTFKSRFSPEALSTPDGLRAAQDVAYTNRMIYPSLPGTLDRLEALDVRKIEPTASGEDQKPGIGDRIYAWWRNDTPAPSSEPFGSKVSVADGAKGRLKETHFDPSANPPSENSPKFDYRAYSGYFMGPKPPPNASADSDNPKASATETLLHFKNLSPGGV